MKYVKKSLFILVILTCFVLHKPTISFATNEPYSFEAHCIIHTSPINADTYVSVGGWAHVTATSYPFLVTSVLWGESGYWSGPSAVNNNLFLHISNPTQMCDYAARMTCKKIKEYFVAQNPFFPVINPSSIAIRYPVNISVLPNSSNVSGMPAPYNYTCK